MADLGKVKLEMQAIGLHGSKRLASRIGGGFAPHPDLNHYDPLTDQVELPHSNDYQHKVLALVDLWTRQAECAGLQPSLEFGYSLAEGNLHNPLSEPADGERYFYHSDHLGSSAFITSEMRSIREDLQKSNTTEQNGYATQFLAYMPFGETLDEQQNSSNYFSPFKFSAKEKDPESGYSYFGARYYSPELSVWLSVDPMADDYPHQSPFAYCSYKPVMRIDPTGMNDDWFENELTGEVHYNSTLKQGDETQLGEGWNWLGPNGMFGQSDAHVLLANHGLTSNGVSLNINNLSAGFTGEHATQFMSKMGYDFLPKVSYEAIRHDFPVNTLLPNGGSVNVELQSGTRVIAASTYVQKGYVQKSSIKVFYQNQHFGTSYTNYSKTNYSYAKPSKLNSFFQYIGITYSILTANYATHSANINVVNGWDSITDQKLLRLKGK